MFVYIKESYVLESTRYASYTKCFDRNNPWYTFLVTLIFHLQKLYNRTVTKIFITEISLLMQNNELSQQANVGVRSRYTASSKMDHFGQYYLKGKF